MFMDAPMMTGATAVLRCGRGIPRNLGLAPSPKYFGYRLTAVFDKLKASAYSCKKERSVTFKLRQNPFPPVRSALPPRSPLGQLTTLLQTP